jgi:thiosulfate/3-mercaptopyruvate sulfurtransferase
MSKAMSFAFIVTLVFSGSGPSFSAEASTHPAFFCPECWRFLEAGDLDGSGQCRVSGRKPIEAEAVALSWTWCLPHQTWHRKPCGQDFAAAVGASALLVPAGSERVTTRAYCPRDHLLAGTVVEGARCPACSRPFVSVSTVDRLWYWCGKEKVWRTRPCDANRNLLVCCTARKGAILAFSWQLPFVNASFDAPSRGKLVEPAWLAAHLDDPHLIVIHVGFDSDVPAAAARPAYLDGHIPGARSLGWPEIVRTRNGIPNELPPVEQLVQMVRSLGIDAEDRIVLYDTGRGLEAARAYWTLDYLGLGENAALLDGQWAAWKALRLPDSRMPEDVEPSAFTPRLRPEILVSLEVMEDLAWLSRQPEGGVTILDARSAEEYRGLQPGKGIPRGGHIDGAKNLAWTTLMEPGEETLLRNEVDLRGIFESAGARPGGLVVVYCRTGVQASMLYFAARMIGYDVKLYDGSYFEWVREHELSALDRQCRW